MSKKSVSLSIGRGEKSRSGGLTAKGRAKYNNATGSNLKAPVSAKQAKKALAMLIEENLFVLECLELKDL